MLIQVDLFWWPFFSLCLKVMLRAHGFLGCWKLNLVTFNLTLKSWGTSLGVKFMLSSSCLNHFGLFRGRSWGIRSDKSWIQGQEDASRSDSLSRQWLLGEIRKKAQRRQLPGYTPLRLISSLMSGRQLSRKGLHGRVGVFVPEVCCMEGNPRVLSKQLRLPWCSVVKARCLAGGWRREYVIGYGDGTACSTWTLLSSLRVHSRSSGLSTYWMPKSEFSCDSEWSQRATYCVECLCEHCPAQRHLSITIFLSHHAQLHFNFFRSQILKEKKYKMYYFDDLVPLIPIYIKISFTPILTKLWMRYFTFCFACFFLSLLFCTKSLKFGMYSVLIEYFDLHQSPFKY